MWFNPAELLENKTAPLANPANYEPENHKEAHPISKLADTLPEKIVIESRKVAEVAAAFVPETNALSVLIYKSVSLIKQQDNNYGI